MQAIYIHPTEVLLPGYPILDFEHRAARMEKLKSQSYFLRGFIIVDAIFLALWSLFTWAFLFAFIFIIVGFYGVKSYKRSAAALYVVYLVANIAVRITWLVRFHPSTFELVLISIGLAILFYILFLLASFIYTLSKMPREDVHVLRLCQNIRPTTVEPTEEDPRVYWPGGQPQQQDQQAEPFHLPPSYSGHYAVPAIPLQVQSYYPQPTMTSIPMATLAHDPTVRNYSSQSDLNNNYNNNITNNSHQNSTTTLQEGQSQNPTHVLASDQTLSPRRSLDEELPVEITSPLLSPPADTYIVESEGDDPKLYERQEDHHWK